MEKVLLIGKTGKDLDRLNEFLKNFFRVLTCTEETQNAPAMLKVVEPDLVVAILNGVYDVDTSIFGILSAEYQDLPVLTLGEKGEFNNFSSSYSNGKLENFTPPLTLEDILVAVCRNLNISVPPHEPVSGTLGVEETESPAGNEDKTLKVPVPGVKRHILVVDDNAMTLRSIKSMLEDVYKVTIANSGMKAMTSMGKEKPDLILLDYEMPVCDGKQTLEMIRADDELQDIPVIFLTGVNDRGHVEAVLKLKPAGYLLKPAVRDRLIDAIERAF